MLLKDKVVLVTGGASREGIGFAAAHLFVEQGARVLLTDIDEQAVCASAASLGEQAIGSACDVRSERSCASAVALALDQWGRLDVLLHCAGVVQARQLKDITKSDYDSVMDVNTRGTLNMLQAVVPVLAPGSSIICIASVSGQRGAGLMGGAHYAASKGAVLALVKSMAREFGRSGIRVNAVNPGVIATGMNANAFDETTKQSIVSGIPLGRFGAPSDVAGACLFLASNLSSYVTGACVDVNGGMHIY